MKVVHVITGLSTGGAEMMLAKVVMGMDRKRFESRVITLESDATLAEQIRAADIEVTSLNLSGKVSDGLSAIRRLNAILGDAQPDLIQTWLYHADLLGGIVGRWRGVPVIWNIQSGTLDPSGIRRRTLAIVRSCAFASRILPRAIVSCSHAGVEVHASLGYARNRFRVIPNGVDLSVFKPSATIRTAVRSELGVSDDMQLIGMVARLHPQKDHQNFFAAAGLLAKSHPHVRFVLVGLGLEMQNENVMRMIRAEEVEGRTILLGLRSDISRLLCAFDIHTLSSAYGEGFPNVLAEAMAAGVPCIVTSIGDSGMIVGDTGKVVPSRNPLALANAWREMLDLSATQFASLRMLARKRVADHFSLAASVGQYEALYEDIRADST